MREYTPTHRSLLQRREPSFNHSVNWVPAFARMIGMGLMLSIPALILNGCQSDQHGADPDSIEFGVGNEEGEKVKLEEILGMSASEIYESTSYVEEFNISDFHLGIPDGLNVKIGDNRWEVESKVMKFLTPTEIEKDTVQLGMDGYPSDNKIIVLATKLGANNPLFNTQQILANFNLEGQMTEIGIRYKCNKSKNLDVWVKKC